VSPLPLPSEVSALPSSGAVSAATSSALVSASAVSLAPPLSLVVSAEPSPSGVTLTLEPAKGGATETLDADVVLPIHPRTAAALERDGLAFGGRVRVVPPAPYLGFTALLRGAAVLVTDSGGAQKEAWFHEVPCVTLRDRTEWVETVEAGGNVLVGDDAEAIAAAIARPPRPASWPALYGDGHAAERIADVLLGS
jgi:hypothetical protein